MNTLTHALAALALGACAFRPTPDWPTVLADVRARYPAVPHVSLEHLLAAEEDPGPLLLDARSAEEYAVSHLRGARHAADLEHALAALADVAPGREVVVYCSVGLRSSALAAELAAHGHPGAANLEGGLFAWANAGHPTHRGAELAPEVHPFDERWGELLTPARRAR